MNKNKIIILTVLLSALNISTAIAAPAGVVEGLQMPAWLERGANVMPLKPGMSLQSGDQVVTGRNAKVLLRLEEGSDVKLGQNARINLTKLAPPKQEGGLFSGLLNVVKGAFRFTTSKFGANRKRTIDVRIGTITAGIRGTDIWGRSNTEKDLVCLLEGKINVESEGTSATMTDPLSFFVKPKNVPADPVGSIDAVTVNEWALETELEKGAGIVNQQGNYFINIMSVSSQQLASSNIKRFHRAGFAADIEEATIAGKQWYRLRINGLSSKSGANRLAETLRSEFNLNGIWVNRA